MVKKPISFAEKNLSFYHSLRHFIMKVCSAVC